MHKLKTVFVASALAACFISATTAIATAALAATAEPSSGPPGTVVTVSGVTTCESTAPTLTFATLDRSSVGSPSVPFTPPSGKLTVPDVPDGEYRIDLSCGAGEDFVPFAVTATPAFTG